MMKRMMILSTLIILVCTACLTFAEDAHPEILAIYSCPETQIITDDARTKELADTLIFLYQDYTYTQYVNHNNRYEIYSSGTFETNFDWKEPDWQFAAPHILTIHTLKLHDVNHQQEAADLTYDINLDRVTDYCLYPDNLRTDLKLVAAFMQVDKQKLVRTDGSEEYLPTIWFYYNDGSFQQYAVVDGQNNVLFSCGDYSVTDPAFTEGAVLKIHRTQKYQDGTGLTDYNSTHEYVIGELGFIRVIP